jgi:hypothetical protein
MFLREKISTTAATLRRRYGVPLVMAVAIFGISLYVNSVFFVKDNPQNLRYFPPYRAGVNMNANVHFGVEYHRIALSLVSTGEFSNPFRHETGPTAWMPPVYPFFLAFLLKSFGTSLAARLPVALCILLLKNSILVATGVLCYKLAKRTCSAIPPVCVLIFYAMFLSCYFLWSFQITHDCWLTLMLMDIILFLALRRQDEPDAPRRIAAFWGVLGGVAALSSPVLGLTWFVAGVPRQVTLRRLRMFAFSALIAGAVVLPWTVRNYLVFDRFVPVKSNLFYDLYNTSYANEDGLFDHEFALRHALFSIDPFGGLSEPAFMDSCKAKFLAALKASPQTYVQAVANRALAASILYHPYRDVERALPVKRAIHLLPLMGVLVLLFTGSVRRSPAVRLVIITYLAYLVPYSFVTYYGRYAMALLASKTLLAFWGVDALVGCVARKKRATPPILGTPGCD